MSASTWLVCTDLRLLAKVLVEANNWSAETIRLPTSGSAAARLFPRRIVDDGWAGSPRPEPLRTAPHRSGYRLQSSSKKVVWRGRPVAQTARPTKVLGSGWIAADVFLCEVDLESLVTSNLFQQLGRSHKRDENACNLSRISPLIWSVAGVVGPSPTPGHTLWWGRLRRGELSRELAAPASQLGAGGSHPFVNFVSLIARAWTRWTHNVVCPWLVCGEWSHDISGPSAEAVACLPCDLSADLQSLPEIVTVEQLIHFLSLVLHGPQCQRFSDYHRFHCGLGTWFGHTIGWPGITIP